MVLLGIDNADLVDWILSGFTATVTALTIYLWRRNRRKQVEQWAAKHSSAADGKAIAGERDGFRFTVDFSTRELEAEEYEERLLTADVTARVETVCLFPEGFTITAKRHLADHQNQLISSGDDRFDAKFPVSASDPEGALRILHIGALRRQVAWLTRSRSDFQIVDGVVTVHAVESFNMAGNPTDIMDETLDTALALAKHMTAACSGEEVPEPPRDVLSTNRQ